MLVDPVQQHAEAQDVGEQHHLLTRRGRYLADPFQEIHCGEPFFTGQTHIAGEIVQVLHQAHEHLAKAIIGRVVEGPLDCFGDGVFIQVG